MISNYQNNRAGGPKHTPSFTSCPTIIGSNKKVIKRKQMRSLNQKRRNSFITEGNCRTASLGWGGRPQFDLCL